LASRLSVNKVSLQEVRLPDGVCSVGGVWSASLSDVADKLPGPCSICAGVQVDTGTVVAPAVARTKDGARRVAGERLSDLGQSRLRTESPTVDLVGQVGDVLPAGTSILALEDWEVVWVVARQRGSGDDGTILQLRVAWVGDALVTSGLVNGVVGKVTPWSWSVVPALRLCNGDLREKRSSDE
jgi:hypothetical protein